MGLMDRILRRKKEGAEEESEESLPSELERFKIPQPGVQEKPSPFTPPQARESFLPPEFKEPLEREKISSQHSASGDKLELIIQKLETIDARLRIIEEKLRR